MCCFRDCPVLDVLCVISLYGQGLCLSKEKNTQLCAALRLQCQPGFNIVRGSDATRHNLCIVGWMGQFPSLVKRPLLRPTQADGSHAF